MVADPALLQSLAVLGASALALGIVAVAAVGLWRAMTDERPLLLARLLAREGVEIAAHANALGARDFALAARRCMHCGARSQCEAVLAGGSSESYAAFCPNAGYIARWKR